MQINNQKILKMLIISILYSQKIYFTIKKRFIYFLFCCFAVGLGAFSDCIRRLSDWIIIVVLCLLYILLVS